MPKTAKTRPNIPMPANVQEDDEFRPIAVSLGGDVLEVVSIDDRVEDEAEWWEPKPVYTMLSGTPPVPRLSSPALALSAFIPDHTSRICHPLGSALSVTVTGFCYFL